jgi:hypothetical protein
MRISPLLALPASLVLVSPGPRPAEAGVDAVSAASMTVKVASITETGAVVQWSKDSYDYGYRTLCYDPAPAAAKNNCKRVEVEDDKGSLTLTGLKPATKYNFRIEATDPDDDEDPYSVTGNFTTLSPPVSLRAPSIREEGPGGSAPAFDVRGRRLEPYRRFPGISMPATGRDR